MLPARWGLSPLPVSLPLGGWGTLWPRRAAQGSVVRGVGGVWTCGRGEQRHWGAAPARLSYASFLQPARPRCERQGGERGLISRGMEEPSLPLEAKFSSLLKP